MTKDPRTPTAISVMGTGRSGTSLITKMLNILGVDLGPNDCFMEPTPANPKGYYELQPIFEINEEILATLGGTWYNPPELCEGWEQSEELVALREKARALIGRLFGGSELWAWKDPRSCWLLPFWRQVMPEMRYIFALRNPLDVARSLERADGLSFDFGMTYWMKALNAALQNTHNEERLFLFYDDILENPEQELLRIADFIGRRETASRPEVVKGVHSFVEKKLHRNRTTLADVLGHEGVTFTAQSLFMVLRAYVNQGGGSFDRELDRFGRHACRFQGQVDQLVDHLAEQDAGPAFQADDRAPEVSVVIPVFNKVDLTKNCLEELYTNTGPERPFEVVVVDNGSSDGTGDFLASAGERYPRLKVVSQERNMGFARACNLGAQTSQGGYVLFLNNDTEVQPGWLKPLAAILDEDDKVAAVGSRMLFPNGTLQHAGVVICDDRMTPDPLVAAHVYNGKPADHPEANEARTYQALTAACLMVRKRSFEAVGGFDEVYWNGYEDVDLCFQFQEQGWLNVYQPESLIIHFASQSGSERYNRARGNMDRLHRKWLSKIEPDLILKPDGTPVPTQAGRIKAYFCI